MQQTKGHRGIFVTGTDTDVGKTWVGQAIIRQLRESGVVVIPRKPVESGWGANIERTDAWLLAKAAGCEEELDTVCPNRFKATVSPVRAASLEGKRLRLCEVVSQCFKAVASDDFLYVEGAGGFFSPLVADAPVADASIVDESSKGLKGLNADLAKSLNLPMLLVVNNKLGCINHVLLTLAAIKSYELPVVAVVLNSVDKTVENKDVNNLEDLEDLLDVPIFQIQFGQSTVPDQLIALML